MRLEEVVSEELTWEEFGLEAAGELTEPTTVVSLLTLIKPAPFITKPLGFAKTKSAFLPAISV